MSELIANKLLHTPLSALKASEHGDLDTMVEVTHRLFALGEEAIAAPEPAAPARPALEVAPAAPKQSQGKK
jgi:hypothetical protein